MSRNYTHGGDIYSHYEKYGRYPVDFSSSLNPLNAPLEVTNAYVEAYKYSFAYPPHDYKELREKIAEKENTGIRERDIEGKSQKSIFIGRGKRRKIRRISYNLSISANEEFTAGYIFLL